jgi:hypothetical protein
MRCRAPGRENGSRRPGRAPARRHLHVAGLPGAGGRLDLVDIQQQMLDHVARRGGQDDQPDRPGQG